MSAATLSSLEMSDQKVYEPHSLLDETSPTHCADFGERSIGRGTATLSRQLSLSISLSISLSLACSLKPTLLTRRADFRERSAGRGAATLSRQHDTRHPHAPYSQAWK